MREPKRGRMAGHDTELELAVWEGEGTPILCVHGLTANSRCFATLADGLSRQNQVVAYDLRGRGLSSKPETGYSIPNHCLDLEALMEGLGLERAHLMGHSLGASIAAVFAAEHPERVDHLVLLDGAGKLNKAQMARVVKGITPSVERLGKVYASKEEYLEVLKQAPFLKPWTEGHDLYFDYELEVVAEGVRSRARLEHIMEEVGNLLDFNISDYYKKITHPTLIARACRGMLGDDILLPANAIARMVRDIKDPWVVSLKRANHYSIVFEKNEIRDRAILNFLSS